ncbi:MAG: DUF4209 domain-containing protein [Pseudomonadota bacterium]
MPSPLEKLNVGLDALELSSFNSVIASSEASCIAYSTALHAASTEAEKLGDTMRAAALQLLAAACQPLLVPSDPYKPFRPYFEMEGRRGIIPSDFSTEQATVLTQIGESVDDAELSARLNDVGWTVLRDVVAARRAITSYLAAADSPYCIAHWPERLNRYERALRLALMICSDDTGVVFERIAAMLNAVTDTIPDGAERAATLMLECRNGEPKDIAAALIGFADLAAQAKNYHRERTLCSIASKAYRKARENQQANAADVRSAEAMVSLAMACKANDQMTAAAHWLAQGVSTLQKCEGQKTRVSALQIELAALGKATLTEMTRQSITFDASELVSKAINVMQCTTVVEALLRFAFMFQPLQREKIETQVVELARSAPFANLADKHMYNGAGRLVAVVPPLLSSQGDDYRRSLAAACYFQAAFQHQAMVVGVILPARDEMWRLHQLSVETLADLFGSSPMFPPGRQSLWLKGLFAGFEGHFDTALSILIPQFEHALRMQLEARGCLVWRIDPTTGYHSERSLGELLDLGESVEILGKDMHFELQGLLSERSGNNFRNEFAHGLMSDATFFSAPAIYLWWMFFRLAVGTRPRKDGMAVPHVADGQENE